MGVGSLLTQIFGECLNICEDALPRRAQIFEQPSISIGQIKTAFVIANAIKYIEVTDITEGRPDNSNLLCRVQRKTLFHGRNDVWGRPNKC